MDFSKTKRLIKKIKNLNNTLSDSNELPSEIERDLMLSYVRDLYEEVKFGVAEVAGHRGKESITPKPIENIEPKVSRPKKVVALVSEAPKVVSTPVQVSKVVTVPVSENKNELEELFNVKEVKELSDKLSMIPISDLTKSMGINEKIFTIKELFGGNQSLYDSTLASLNKLGSFDEAKNFLIGDVASKNNWHLEQKRNKAVNFLRLVKRRYV